MPALKLKNPLSQAYYDGRKIVETRPAYKVYVRNGNIIDFEYTEDPTRKNIFGPAVWVGFEDGTSLFVDTEEVVI